MLVAGQQDVGHEDVATGSGALSLRSLRQAVSAFCVIQLQRLEAQDISIVSTGKNIPFEPLSYTPHFWASRFSFLCYYDIDVGEGILDDKGCFGY